MELPVAGNIKYLFMLTDALLNINLHQTVTSSFFKRGVQNIEIAGQKMNSFSDSINYTLTDSEKNVKELAAAMRDNKPTLFLTLTLNQKEHFGVWPLIKAVESLFPDKTSEKYRACMQTYMPVILRMWSLTVDHLNKYLLESSERLLGEIVNIWGRTEFQSLIRNVPHYHLLLWLKNITLEELKDLVASTKKHLRFKFDELLHSDLQIVKNTHDMEQIFESFVKIHTHNCEKGNNRCMKKTDAQRNKVCRFPSYQPSNITWLKEIPQRFSDEAMSVLLEVGLAEGEIDDFELVQEVKCHKFSYHATNKDHIMPNSPTLFALTLSSGNVSLITDKMATKYLNKYAAGKEEHTEVFVSAGSSEKRMKVNVGQIENNNITGVKINTEKEEGSTRQTKGISALHVSQTEFMWWTLKLPSVITTLDFVHVPSVSLANRGAILKKGEKNDTVGAIHIAPFLSVRESLNLPVECCFTANQKTVIKDIENSILSVDKVTKFSVRPPQLLFVRQLKQY